MGISFFRIRGTCAMSLNAVLVPGLEMPEQHKSEQISEELAEARAI
jgi:hypothetical protein